MNLKSVSDKVLAVLDRAVAASPPPPPPKANTAFVLAGKFQDRAGQLFITADDLKQVVAAEVAWQAAWRAVNISFTEAAARDAYRTQITAHAELSSDENFSSVRTRGLESFFSEFMAKQDAGRAQMVAIVRRVAPVIEAAVSKFIAAGEAWIAARLAKEKAVSAEYGVEFRPSPVLESARRAVATQKFRQENGVASYSSPSSAIEFLNLGN